MSNTIATTRKIWINAPIVDPLIRPRIQRMMRMIAIVDNINMFLMILNNKLTLHICRRIRCYLLTKNYRNCSMYIQKDARWEL